MAYRDTECRSFHAFIYISAISITKETRQKKNVYTRNIVCAVSSEG